MTALHKPVMVSTVVKMVMFFGFSENLCQDSCCCMRVVHEAVVQLYHVVLMLPLRPFDWTQTGHQLR